MMNNLNYKPINFTFLLLEVVVAMVDVVVVGVPCQVVVDLEDQVALGDPQLDHLEVVSCPSVEVDLVALGDLEALGHLMGEDLVVKEALLA